MQPTALVHEAYLCRLITSACTGRTAHFFAVADQLMRRILVEHARAQARLKRGGELQQVSLSAAQATQQRSPDLVALDDALNDLAALDARQSRVVELRFFGGLSLEEIAAVLNVSVGAVRRDWSLAQAWLYTQLNKKGEP